jgi:hypothetical protein
MIHGRRQKMDNEAPVEATKSPGTIKPEELEGLVCRLQALQTAVGVHQRALERIVDQWSRKADELDAQGVTGPSSTLIRRMVTDLQTCIGEVEEDEDEQAG